jgi:hypothetical protein
MTIKRYKIQALLTLSGSNSAPAAVPAGQVRRTLVRGQHHQTHVSQYFTCLVANNGEGADWLADNHLIVTIELAGEDPGTYFHIGDQIALRLGGDFASGVVSRRLFV